MWVSSINKLINFKYFMSLLKTSVVNDKIKSKFGLSQQKSECLVYGFMHEYDMLFLNDIIQIIYKFYDISWENIYFGIIEGESKCICEYDIISQKVINQYNGIEFLYNNGGLASFCYDSYGKNIYRIGSYADELNQIENIKYNIVTNKLTYLPQLQQQRKICHSVYSKNHGIITLGGYYYDENNKLNYTDTVEQYKSDQDNWKYLTNMDNGKASITTHLFTHNNNEYIIECGGYNGTEYFKSASLYDFNKNKWKSIKNMNCPRILSGLCFNYNNNNIICGGGYASDWTSKRVEYYDFIKNDWYLLPDTKKSHKYRPCIYVNNNNIITISGENCEDSRVKSVWGSIEMYDIRDNAKKWYTLCDIQNIFEFTGESAILACILKK